METTIKRKIPVISPMLNFFKTFHQRFVKGSWGTKLSHFIMGSGNFYRKQYIKGALFLLLQVGFILFMVISPGIQYIQNIDNLKAVCVDTWTSNGINPEKVGYVYFGFRGLVELFGHGPNHTLGYEFIDEDSWGSLVDCSFVDDSRFVLLFGVITIGIIFIYIFAWLSSIKSSYKADLDVADNKKPSTFVEDCKSLLDGKFHVLMLTPTLLAALFFTILPTLFMILIAFTNYGVSGDDIITAGVQLVSWDGFKHFTDVFRGEGEIAARFFPVLGWTVVWAIIATFSCYFGGILLALLINKKEVKFKKLWRTIFILTIALPQFISLLSVSKILMNAGPVNKLLVSIGILKENNTFEFLSGEGVNANTARITILIVNMWLGIPYTMLQTSGILMNIPNDLYEAATIDGANKKQMFRNITLPYIIFVTTPYLISSFVGNLNSFNVIFFLTGGGPAIEGGGYAAGQTDLLVTWLYKLTVEKAQYNLGAVIGIFTFMITSTITLITYRRSKAYNEEDTFQ